MERIGQYEVIEKLGEGGMGVVYKGRDPRFDRFVAIKLLHPSLLTDAQVLERFKAEAVIQAKLSHPNIVSVYDFIFEETRLAMVLEFIEGRPLSAVLETEGALPLERGVALMAQVLSALDYAHDCGLVHRDIKPANIMVQRVRNDEIARVMDFGIAKILGADKQRTAASAKMGTLAYMSPEHLRSPRDVDQRSDIYSLGVTLFEMLTGRLPFDAETEYDLMRRIVEEPPEIPLERAEAIPPPVRQALLRAMAKDPAERFQECGDFRAELMGFAATQHLSASVLQAARAAAPPMPPAIAPPATPPAPSPYSATPPPPRAASGPIFEAHAAGRPERPPGAKGLGLGLGIAAGAAVLAVGLFLGLGGNKESGDAQPLLPAAPPAPAPPAATVAPLPEPTPAALTAADVQRLLDEKLEAKKQADAAVGREERQKNLTAARTRIRADLDRIREGLAAGALEGLDTEVAKAQGAASLFAADLRSELEELQSLEGQVDAAKREQDRKRSEDDAAREGARLAGRTMDTIQNLFAQKKYAEAKSMAQQLADDPETPAAIAADARSMVTRASEAMKSAWGGASIQNEKTQVVKPRGGSDL